ncbi:Thioredoxin, putative [Hondaea fermentalgiana]|uniref:Thioredoxin, putative n=1 Tax=Hondaea fermentalgiana TaxID=2315210 RepID=A0A2R5FZS4_9STRA|nr:Thioredoxin, putative [Hondaea fermentalgiana]|eukprot:GBG24262.1 Thioredoxin, putative [Hondaea fermentalgiana]
MDVRSAIPKAGSLQELQELRRSEALLGIYFYEDSGACHKLAPTLEKLATDKQYKQVSFVRVDVVTCDEDVREKYEVEHAPCFMFYKNDTRVDYIREGDMRAVRSALEKLTKHVRRINSPAEFDTVKTVHERLIVHFFSEWAIDCERVAETLENLASRKPENDDTAVKFARVDINECEALARDFRILTVPTFLILRNGIVVDQFVGAPTTGNEGGDDDDDDLHGFGDAIRLLEQNLGPNPRPIT